ncbi:MAG TPA: ABC transporter permease [Blastocatellia bacterium]|nr:ABC transporter permease [Blastocatellia bacterium]
MSTLWQDVRYGARMLMKNPGFAVVAVVTLALGIGANTAIFSIVNGLLLSPLPYRNADRLAIIWTHSPGANVAQDWPSPGQFSALKTEDSVFEELALAQGSNVIVAGGGEPERVGAVRASSAVFSLLELEAAIGRVFLPEEDTPDKTPTVILSHGYWQRRFGGDQNALGSTLTINGRDYQVVGVMPPDFSLDYEVMPTVGNVAKAEILMPLPLSADGMNNQGDENYNVLARLKPGATIAQAQAELNLDVARLEQQFPDRYPPSRRFSFSIRPLLEQAVGDVRLALYVLLGAVGCVLLIACANVANLLLARAAAREREMAIRTAMGARRRRVIRQLLTESVLVSALGGALGLLLAVWGLALLRWLDPGNIPRLATIRMDNRVMAFTTVVAVLTGILFGLAPAVRSSRVNLSETLKEGARSLAGAGHRLRNLLVVMEIALSLVLLVCAGLLIRSFIQVEQVNPGFKPQNVLSMRLSLVGPAYSEESRRASFYEQLWERIRGLPGVEAAGGVSSLPLTGGIGWGSITIEGYDASSGQSVIQSDMRAASIGYFETMKIPLISGRFFGDQDTKGSEPVVIVDENMSRTYWPNSDPIGKRLKFGRADNKNPWMKVVGVVGEVKHYALDTDSRVALYVPHLQSGAGSLAIAVRTTSDPAGIGAAVTREARAIDPNLPIFNVKTMEQWLSESLARRRFAMLMLGLFALVALLLAAVGIYGVMSYTVAQRTREIGVRVALGAQTGEVLRMVVQQGMSLAGIGIGIGLVTSLFATRLMTGLLFGVRAADLITFVTIVAVLAVTALLACLIPAQRATRVDPMIALRYE